MKSTKRSWDLLTEEQRATAVSKIIDFFATERGEEIGVIAAGEVLDMFLQTAGAALYNKGVEDAQSFMKDRWEELVLDLEVSVKK